MSGTLSTPRGGEGRVQMRSEQALSDQLFSSSQPISPQPLPQRFIAKHVHCQESCRNSTLVWRKRNEKEEKKNTPQATEVPVRHFKRTILARRASLAVMVAAES